MSISVSLIGQNYFTDMEKTRETLWAFLWSMKSCREQKKKKNKLQNYGSPWKRARVNPRAARRTQTVPANFPWSLYKHEHGEWERERVAHESPGALVDSEEVLHVCLADTEPASAAAFAARWGPDHLCPFSLDKIRKILCIYRYTCGQITWTLFPLTHPEFCLRLGTNFTNCDSPRLRPPQRWTPVICLQRVWGV